MLKRFFFAASVVLACERAEAQMPSPYVVPNQDWIKFYSQSDAINSAPNALDANSNVYSTGYSGLSASADLLVLKYDSTGALKYNYVYNNGGADIGKAIKVDPSGRAYVAGISAGTTTGNDYIVVKLSTTGTVVWTKRFDAGINGWDEANDITCNINGDVFVTGKSRNSFGNFDIITLKLASSTGAVVWQHTYAGTSGLDDIGTGVVLSSNGQYLYVTGNTTNSSTGSNIVTYGINVSTGTTFWTGPIINGTANGSDKSNAIILSGANVVVCGEVTNAGTGLDFVTIKYSGTTGAILWQKYYDYATAANRATCLVRDSAAHIGVVGTALNGTIYEYHTVFYDSTGTQFTINKESTGLTGLNTDPKICNDTIAHHWYVSGEIMSATKDIFVYQIVPSGNTGWRQIIDGHSDVDLASDIAVNGVGVVYVGAQAKNSTANYDFTTIKLDQTPLYWPPDFTGEVVNNNFLYLPNKGQLMRSNGTYASEVLYYTKNTKPEIYIEKGAFDFVFNHTDTIKSTLDTLERIQYQFLEYNVLSNQHEYLPKLAKNNFYLGYAQSPAIENLQGNQRIFIPNYYPYIDLHYYSGAGGMKYYFVVKPGANIAVARMQINGAVSTSIDGTGKLVLAGNLGTVKLNKPIAYTVNNIGQVVTISGSAAWQSGGSNVYTILPPTYNTALPLIIEVSTTQIVSIANGIAANLDYSTYYGGQEAEQFNDVFACANGDRYVTGYTTAGTFPAVNSLNNYNGNIDAILMKYTADDTLRYATFQGGSASDIANSVAVDSQGNAYIGGQTFSTDMNGFNVTGATNQASNGGATTAFKADGFICKLASLNNSLIWRRYFGGSGSETINSICMDGSDNFYIAGYSSSSDCPVINAFKGTLTPPTTANPSNTDAIFGKFNSSMVAQWITYYGGSSNAAGGGSAQQDWGMDIAVDNGGHVIGGGFTDANNLATTNSTGNSNTFYDNTANGSTDGFLVRYSSAGTPDFSSYFGGSNSDGIYRLVYKNGLDQIYFAGNSYKGTGFPFLAKSGATNSQYCGTGQTSFLGYMDGSLTKQWCSYYGKGQVGMQGYYTTGLSVDNSGLVYLSGHTTSDTLQKPGTTPPGVYVDNTRQAEDGFIAIYTPAKVLYHAHYLGGAAGDQILNSDIAQNQKLYVTGYSGSTNFPIAYTPVTAALVDSTYAGGQDGFITRFQLSIYQITGVQKFDLGNSSSLTVYPNPANTRFTLELSEELSLGTTVKVYTLMGQLVHSSDLTEKTSQIDCASWANGVYLINVSNNDSQKTFKLIKQ